MRGGNESPPVSQEASESAFRNRVLFLEARFEIPEVRWDTGLRALRGRPEYWTGHETRCLSSWAARNGQIRVAQKFARDDDCVRLSSRDYVIGLNGGRDHPNGTRQDVGLAADPLRERRLIAQTDRDYCIR